MMPRRVLTDCSRRTVPHRWSDPIHHGGH
jgi:hypothetical protein